MFSVLFLLMLGLFRYIAGQVSGDLRIIGFSSNDRIAGRLEVYNSGEWGTVCDDSFDNSDAQVACRQLGYSPQTGTTIGNAAPDKIWLDEVACSGTESRLSDCTHAAWNVNDCKHNEDVNILCSVEQPVNGNWGCWSGWSTCDVTCGRGIQHRNRICNNPSAKNGGRPCIGESSEELPCNVILCPVNGGWNIWSNWTDCTTSCGGGLQTRIRHCNSPPALNGGDYCDGNATETKLCNTIYCEVSERFSVLEVAGVALGSTAVTICIIVIGVCFYNKYVGSRKALGHHIVTHTSRNEYILQNIEDKVDPLQSKTQDDVNENTEELYEIVE